MGAAGTNDTPTLQEYLQVVRRRKLVILLTVALTTAVAVGLSVRQDKLYEGSSQVLLNRQNLANSLTGTQDPNLYQPAERLAETQAKLARVPTVAARTLDAVGAKGRTVADFLASSAVTSEANADLLDFRVTDASRPLALRLASEYARQFTIYRHQLDTSAIQRALDEVDAQLAKLEAAKEEKTPLYASLLTKKQQLQTLAALQVSNASVVKAGAKAVQVRPRPLRDALLALAISLVAGIALAFLREALDTRVRSADEIKEYLETPLLGRVPESPKDVTRKDQLVILARPAAPQAEALRMVRTNLEFTRRERDAQTVLFTSPSMSEGKSTTIANIAVASARAGLRVVLVDPTSGARRSTGSSAWTARA